MRGRPIAATIVLVTPISRRLFVFAEETICVVAAISSFSDNPFFNAILF